MDKKMDRKKYIPPKLVSLRDSVIYGMAPEECMDGFSPSCHPDPCWGGSGAEGCSGGNDAI